MSNTKTLVEQFEVKDLEDNSAIRVLVEHCTEVGNAGRPGVQVHYMGNIVCFEPLMAERLAYQAPIEGVAGPGFRHPPREVFARVAAVFDILIYRLTGP